LSSSRRFLVIVHDVAPPFAAAIHTILSQLQPLLHGQISAAVVPCWHGCSLAQADTAFQQQLTQFGEHLLHGHYHHQPSHTGWVSRLTNQANEFTGLSAHEAEQRLHWGQQVLQEAMGLEVAGFVPPAWQWGGVTPALMSRCDLRFGVGFHAIYGVAGGCWHLSTWSWDTGRIASLGYVAHGLGLLQWALRPRAIPCLVFHPADDERGFLPLGVRLVRFFLNRGYRPIMFRDVVS